MSIWVTSDLHFNHKNIIGYCREQFHTIEEHNEYIIQRFNSVVMKDDLVYILGDVGFTPAKELKPLIQKLNGRKILIVGNHDKFTDGEYLSMGFIQVHRHPVYFSTNIILSHIPIIEAYNNPWVINVHGHVHNGKINLSNYFNVNVEENDFLPINMENFKEIALKMCKPSRYQPYREEWYAQWEQKTKTVIK